MEAKYEIFNPPTLAEHDVSCLRLLTMQLSHAPVFREDIERGMKAHTLIVVRNDRGYIVGMATLVRITKLSGRVCLIEDLAVNNNVRGSETEEELMEFVLKIAQSSDFKRIELVSTSTRIEVKRMYRRLGFKRRKAGVYRFQCDRS